MQLEVVVKGERLFAGFGDADLDLELAPAEAVGC